jgi:hypothetical protein
MAGKMTGAKGMAAARMGSKMPQPPMPHKNPRSAHIREANGGYIMSMHGGDGEPMGSDHIAPDMGTIMNKLKAHMIGAEGGEDPSQETDETPDAEVSEAVGEPKAKPKKKASKPAPKKSAVKVRDYSETY